MRLFKLLQTVLCVTVIAEKGYEGDHYLTWALFAALIISGVVTALQAIRLGRFGTRHMLITGATPNFIAISITALTGGGPELLASLMVASALFQFAMGAWLPLLRRIITPVVAGTVIMLIAVVVFPVAIERMEVLPEGASLIAAPATAPGNTDRRSGDGTASHRGIAALVDAHRDSGGLYSGGVPRCVRLPACA